MRNGTLRLRPRLKQGCQAHHSTWVSEVAQDWLTSLETLLFMLRIQCDQEWCMKEALSFRTVYVFISTYFRQPEHNWSCAGNFLFSGISKSTHSRIIFAPFFLISSSLFLLTTYSYDFEANACGWFPWYKTTSFMERALQPALIGHDVFQALWINTDALALQVLSS